MFTERKDALGAAEILARVAGTRLKEPDVYECEPGVWWVVDEADDRCVCHIVRVVFARNVSGTHRRFAVLLSDGHDQELHRVVDLMTMAAAVEALLTP